MRPFSQTLKVDFECGISWITLTKAMATKANQASINLTIAIEKIAAKRQTTQMSRGATNLLVASCRDAIIIGHEYSEWDWVVTWLTEWLWPGFPINITYWVELLSIAQHTVRSIFSRCCTHTIELFKRIEIVRLWIFKLE